MSWCLVSYCNIDIGIPIYLHDPPCVLHHVFGKKTPHDLGPSSSKRTIRMPECCASAKNGGSPTHLSSTPHLWATKKFGFKTFVLHRWISMDCSKKNCWLNNGLQIYCFLRCHTIFWRHSKISKHPAFQSQVLWILPRPRFGNFSWSFGQNPWKPLSFVPPGWQSN